MHIEYIRFIRRFHNKMRMQYDLPFLSSFKKIWGKFFHFETIIEKISKRKDAVVLFFYNSVFVRWNSQGHQDLGHLDLHKWLLQDAVWGWILKAN